MLLPHPLRPPPTCASFTSRAARSGTPVQTSKPYMKGINKLKTDSFGAATIPSSQGVGRVGTQCRRVILGVQSKAGLRSSAGPAGGAGAAPASRQRPGAAPPSTEPPRIGKNRKEADTSTHTSGLPSIQLGRAGWGAPPPPGLGPSGRGPAPPPPPATRRGLQTAAAAADSSLPRSAGAVRAWTAPRARRPPARPRRRAAASRWSGSPRPCQSA